MALGPELVTNGGFDTDSDWEKVDYFAIANGVATATGSKSSISQSIAISADSFYQIQFDITAITEGKVKFKLGGTSGTIRDAVGTYIEISKAGSFNTDIEFRTEGARINFSIDNVSVKEYTGERYFIGSTV